MARETGGCRQLGQTDTAGAGPIQTTAECYLSVVWGVRERGPQDQELCMGRRQRKALRANPGPGRVSGTKACRERFCNIGAMYPIGQGTGTPPREDWKQKMRTEAGAKAKAGPCPVCKKNVYQRRLPWGSLSWPSDRVQECTAFQALSPQQRTKVIQEQGGCVVCMSWAHAQARCKRVRHNTEGGPSIGCQEKEGIGGVAYLITGFCTGASLPMAPPMR